MCARVKVTDMRRSTPHVVAVLLLLGAAGPLCAQDVTIRLVDGPLRTGRLDTFSLDGGLNARFATGPELIGARDIVSVASRGVARRSTDSATLVLLADGGQLYGALPEADEDRLTLNHHVLGRLTIPLEDVAAIIMPGAPAPLTRRIALMIRRPSAGSDERPPRLIDEFWFANGDRLSGTLVALDEEAARVETDGGHTDIAPKYLHAAILASPPPSPAEGLSGVLTLADGSSLRVTEFEWAGETIQARRPGTADLSLPAAQLERVDIHGGRWQRLGELTPLEYAHRSLTGRQRPYSVDVNILGAPLRIDGRTFAHGIGLPGGSKLAYDLAGGYMRFTAELGLDDSAAQFGDVDVTILVDEQQRFRQSSLRAGRRPVTLDIDVAGARRLEIIIDYGQNADIQDRVNLIDAALARAR